MAHHANPLTLHGQLFYKMDTSMEVRQLIIQNHQKNKSTRQIANIVNKLQSTVKDIILHYRRTDEIGPTRQGRAPTNKIITARDRRRLRLASLDESQASGRQL